MQHSNSLRHLGKVTPISLKYDASILERIPRRDFELLPKKALGSDQWTLYEMSCRLTDGSFNTFVGDLKIPLLSPFILESKSLKLYLFALANRSFDSVAEFERTVRRDLTYALDAPIKLQLYSANQWAAKTQRSFKSYYESSLDMKLKPYAFENFRSRCPVTLQPDWASIFVFSDCPQLCATSVSKAITAVLDHADFHELCISRIYSRLIETHCFNQLMVLGRFTRRGGIDINPVRANFAHQIENIPFVLQ